MKKKVVARLENALEVYFADKAADAAVLAALDQCRWAADFVARRAVVLPESELDKEKEEDEEN